MTHICVGNLTIIGPDSGLSPGRRQVIIWTNAWILLIGPWGTNFSAILVGIQTFSFKKMHLKMSSAKWRPFCLGLNVFNEISGTLHGWFWMLTRRCLQCVKMGYLNRIFFSFSSNIKRLLIWYIYMYIYICRICAYVTNTKNRPVANRSWMSHYIHCFIRM